MLFSTCPPSQPVHVAYACAGAVDPQLGAGALHSHQAKKKMAPSYQMHFVRKQCTIRAHSFYSTTLLSFHS